MSSFYFVAELNIEGVVTADNVLDAQRIINESIVDALRSMTHLQVSNIKMDVELSR